VHGLLIYHNSPKKFICGSTNLVGDPSFLPTNRINQCNCKGFKILGFSFDSNRHRQNFGKPIGLLLDHKGIYPRRSRKRQVCSFS